MVFVEHHTPFNVLYNMLYKYICEGDTPPFGTQYSGGGGGFRPVPVGNLRNNSVKRSFSLIRNTFENVRLRSGIVSKLHISKCFAC